MHIVKRLEGFNMVQLTVSTSTHDYPIYIAENSRFRLKDLLPKDYSSIFIITDDTVASLYLDDIKKALKGDRIVEAIIPSGEFSKNIEQFYQLHTIAMENYLDRKSLIIALGGGVVGDLAGFVAATFMRGIDYIQVPTTILSHDSSVGGKVAINHELGKNMIGNFYPPQAVIYDVETLQSLPVHEVRSGYAEIVKEAYIADGSLLDHVLASDIQKVTSDQLSSHLTAGIQIKANIVEQDEKETHIRKFLNFGHTLAHALETELDYGGITHGEAVAIGMLFALYVSEEHYKTDLRSADYKKWMQQNDYPISLFNIEVGQFMKHMKLDKKAQSGQIQMVLLESIANPQVVELTDEELITYLELFMKELDEA